MHKRKILLFFYLIVICVCVNAQTENIINDAINKTVVFGNDKIKMTLDYDSKVNVSSVVINDQKVIDGNEGIYSMIKDKSKIFSTLDLLSQPSVKIMNNTIAITNIKYGDKTNPINETWKFVVTNNNIQFTITRVLAKQMTVEKISSPAFLFKDTAVWDGAYTDYGGLAWFYLFNKPLDTYGVHTNSSEFWNSKTGNGLMISVTSPGKHIATDYSRTAKDEIACNIAVAQNEIIPRFDSGTQRRRYVRDTTDVWAPIKIDAGTTTTSITLSWIDYKKTSDRGNFVGINGDEVTAVLNTIARIGVIDKQHFGGNSWHTPYGPICLHEQYIAQLGLAINDSNYLKGYRDCLDYYRDNAITKEGRVWPRWAYSNEDAMPGKFTDKGFYEAQWGYLLDANPDFVTNVAELYDMNGDLSWVRTQQKACEKALDWILKRDSNNNGLVEMMTDSHTQKRGSDWIDIIWASYENAFVNAKLYHALMLWSKIEKQLGNEIKSKYYEQFAARLKASFNKSTTEGGFWDVDKKCYVHWLDKDGSVHGNNMVTPVNFMAIAYGICDDEDRTKTILDDIETQMQKENLFFWPICMYSYKEGEGNDWQFPFPNYENGDIFLSWGSVAAKAYASYKPELAVKYIKKVLAQYSKDGLAFQRYGRAKQDGLGDDILSGNSLSVVGLYQAVYGINPKYNRLYLDPHITKELAGTRVKYNYRDQQLLIDLNVDAYAVSNDRFKIISKGDFGFYSKGDELSYFNSKNDVASLLMKTTAEKKVTVDIDTWSQSEISWIQTADDTHSVHYIDKLNGLDPNCNYEVSVNGKIIKEARSSADGSIMFEYTGFQNTGSNRIFIRKK